MMAEVLARRTFRYFHDAEKARVFAKPNPLRTCAKITIYACADTSQITGRHISKNKETDGLPIYYDKVSDDTIKLYPGPATASCTLTSGLKVRFKRTAHLFTASDTTAVPGFQSPYHVILAYMAAIPYCMTYKPNRVPLYEKKVDELKKGLIKAYSLRQKDAPMVMYNTGILHR